MKNTGYSTEKSKLRQKSAQNPSKTNIAIFHFLPILVDFLGIILWFLEFLRLAHAIAPIL
jgi:hypothetical protein